MRIAAVAPTAPPAMAGLRYGHAWRHPPPGGKIAGLVAKHSEHCLCAGSAYSPAYTGSCIPRRTRRHQTIGPTCLARRVYIECISRCAEWANRDTVGVVRPVAAHVRRGIMVAWGQYRLCACTAVCSTGQGLVLSVFGGTAGVDWRRVRDSNPRGYYRAKGFTHWILDPAQ